MNRLFLALAVKLDDYNAIQRDFSNVIEGRWVREENLHITLCFFGDCVAKEHLVNTLPSLLHTIEPLKLSSLEYFSHNKILYVKTFSQELNELHKKICSHYDIKQRESFILHVTLMRIKKLKDKELFDDLLKHYEKKKLGSVAQRCHLLQSHLHPEGAKYEVLF